MSKMIEVKTADLIGPALDWAAAKADGRHYVINAGFFNNCRPSTDWSHGGPLRDKYSVALYDVTQGKVAATLRRGMDEHWIDESEYDADATGSTALIAMCRAIVRAKLGDTVQVPAELVEVSA